MSDYLKATINAMLGLASLALVAVLWRNSYLLTILLLVLAFTMLLIRAEKRSYIVFIIGFMFGPLAEAVCIRQGAWTYAGPTILGVPVWLPFLWANASLFIVNTEYLSHVIFRERTVSPRQVNTNNRLEPVRMRTEDLFRVSVKAVIFNAKGEVLIVKEHGRDWWDIPGGGMNHGESIRDTLTRELQEEVALTGNFTFTSILAEDPRLLASSDIHQMRLTFLVTPDSLDVRPGVDGDEVAFMDPTFFKHAQLPAEQKIYEYAELGRTFL